MYLKLQVIITKLMKKLKKHNQGIPESELEKNCLWTKKMRKERTRKRQVFPSPTNLSYMQMLRMKMSWVRCCILVGDGDEE